MNHKLPAKYYQLRTKSYELLRRTPNGATTNYQLKSGFSLAEVLMAVGILTVAMIFIAGVFPVGIYFTNLSADRTIAAIAADEAFAKIKLYVYDANDTLDLSGIDEGRMRDFNDWVEVSTFLDEVAFDEFFYPSTPNIDTADKQYCWSALCRKIDRSLVQVTVFISRKVGSGTDYRAMDDDWGNQFDYGTVDLLETSDWPRPIKIEVENTLDLQDNELRILNSDENLINDGYTIVDDENGQIYRVLERYAYDKDNPDLDKIILLDKDWAGDKFVWVVPPPIGKGRGPCVGVYQRVIRF